MTNKKEQDLEAMRHSLSHIMMQALERLYGAIPGIGPAIEYGLYHDFDCDYQVVEADLGKIEKEMKKIIKENLPIKKKVMPINEGIKFLKKKGYKHTVELAQDLKKEKEKEIIFYGQGEFINMCKGPHVKSTGQVGEFKLTKLAGAYWKGDEKNKMIQRIYGVAFNTKKELNEHLKMIEEAEKRDHRKLGKELDLFVFSDEVGPGLPLWTPRGTVIRDELEKWAKETEGQWGYVRVATPHIAKHTLYEISGHLPYYKDDMYSPMDIDGEEYYLKGMNCPHHHMIYLSQNKSYRDLPLRLAEYGMVYRYEQSGTLFGLMRARSICQNDAHIYCTMDQAEKEFLDVLKLHEYYYNALGLTKNDYYIAIGLPDESKRDKYHGDKELWEKAEQMMRNAIKKSGIESKDDPGGAAFYGPKIDFNIISSTGREFGISTNQLDLYMPRRFNLVYTDKGGAKKHCVVIHRAPLGSHERFIGFLIEHYAGAFPVWLSPVQVKIISVGKAHIKYCHKLASEFREHGIRIEVDDANETVGNKIRKANNEKVPYMLVVGDKEMKGKELAVRDRGVDKVRLASKKEFINEIKEKIKNKK